MTDDRHDGRHDLNHLGTAPTVNELGDWADDLGAAPEAELTPRSRGGARATGRKAGRPSKRTPETRDRLVRAASLGFSSLEAIARAAGVSKDTLDRMRAADPDLDAELHQSREAALDRIEASVLMAAAEDPRIGLAVLKVRRPSAYADRSRLEIGDGVRVGILAQLPSLTDEELGGAMRALEAVIGTEAKEETAPKTAEEQGETDR